MSSFSVILENYTLDELKFLLAAYFVPSSTVTTKKQALNAIQRWLTPTTLIRTDDPLQAIRDGVGFTMASAVNVNIKKDVFGNILLSDVVTNDLSKYPMKDAFDENPFDLIQGYASAKDPDTYFQRITGKDPQLFLNNTEKIFYLTRGYGRPNKYLSLKDLELRKFYGNVDPTAMIALMDVFQICPGRQNPDEIRENLSGFDLTSINGFHKSTMEKITNCLQGCGETCSSDKLSCFDDFLTSIGMLHIYEYNQKYGVFVSNLSQLSLYAKVQPNRKWNFDEVKGLPDELVKGYIATLPDDEILKITSPNGLRLVDFLNLDKLMVRLRDNLVMTANAFLTVEKHFLWDINGYKIVYGRFVDEDVDIFTVEEFLESLEDAQFLVDPKGNLVDPHDADIIYQAVPEKILDDLLNKTNFRENHIYTQIQNISEDQLKYLINSFRTLLEFELNLDDVEEVVMKTPGKELVLHSHRDGWFCTGLTFEEYFKLRKPLNREMIKDSLKYYLEALGQVLISQ